MASSSEPENLSPNIFIPEEWSEAANSMALDSVTSPPPIAFIYGAKNSGKTTFSHHLLKILLQSTYRRVAYLDMDVGQSKFTAPGFLSLTVVAKMTPDLTVPRLKTPKRSFFFGDVSSKRDPLAYVKYSHALTDYYKKKCNMSNKSESPNRAELPLVVNTSGWVKGIVRGIDTFKGLLYLITPVP